jgi:hypothetical protein
VNFLGGKKSTFSANNKQNVIIRGRFVSKIIRRGTKMRLWGRNETRPRAANEKILSLPTIF